MAKGEDLFLKPFPSRLLFRYEPDPRQSAGFEEILVLTIARFRPPIHGEKLGKGARDGSVVESQGDESALLIQRVAEPERAGLQPRPVRAERIG
jgi:hypothetical protein